MTPLARTDRSRIGQWWWTVDRGSVCAIFALITIGVLLSLSSSPAASVRVGVNEPFYFFFRQAFYAAAAIGVMFTVSNLSPKGVRRLAGIVYICAILAMVATLFIGHSAKGAQRWIVLGGFTLQPSEFMKPALITLAAWLFAERAKGEGFPGTAVAFGLYGLAVILLLLQPDFGQTVLVTMAFGATFFLAGVPLIWIALLALLAAVGAWGAYHVFPHVAERIDIFLNPAAGDTYQIDQAFNAIAEGGLLGSGPGEGAVKHLLPDSHTDFIYAVAAEEFGLFMSLTLIALMATVVVRGLLRAMRLADQFEQLAAAGLFILFGFQAFINLAVNLRLFPPKGMTLPLISYGGSSMLAVALTLGFALALTRRRPGAFESPHQIPAGL